MKKISELLALLSKYYFISKRRRREYGPSIDRYSNHSFFDGIYFLHSFKMESEEKNKKAEPRMFGYSIIMICDRPNKKVPEHKQEKLFLLYFFPI